MEEVIAGIHAATTGLGPRDTVVCLGLAVKVEGETYLFEWLVRTDTVPPGASAIHHLTAEDLVRGLTWEEAFEELEMVCVGYEVDVLVAFNSEFTIGYVFGEDIPTWAQSMDVIDVGERIWDVEDAPWKFTEYWYAKKLYLREDAAKVYPLRGEAAALATLQMWESLSDR